MLLHDLAHTLGAAVGDETLVERLTVGASGVVPLALPRLVAWLHEHPGPPTIVLDDVHHLQSAEALDVLARAVRPGARRARPCCSASRSRPALPLARLRAGGRLLEIDAGDLRMTPAEGAAMLRAAGARVSDEEAALVVRRTGAGPRPLPRRPCCCATATPTEPDGAIGPDDPHLVEYVRDEVLANAGPAACGVPHAVVDLRRAASRSLRRRAWSVRTPPSGCGRSSRPTCS